MTVAMEMTEDQRQWYNELVMIASSNLRTVPPMTLLVEVFNNGVSPMEAYESLYPETGLAATPLETIEEEQATDLTDIHEVNEQELAAIRLAESIEPAGITEAQVLAKIVKKTFTRMPSGRTIVCEITMQNGFTARGESSVVLEGYGDPEVGKSQALVRAVQSVWSYEAYLLREVLYQQSKPKVGLIERDT